MLGTELGSEFTDECASEFAAKGAFAKLRNSRTLRVRGGVRDRFQYRFHVEFTFVKRPNMQHNSRFFVAVNRRRKIGEVEVYINGATATSFIDDQRTTWLGGINSAFKTIRRADWLAMQFCQPCSTPSTLSIP
ncbi:hypothetical protein JB92DRAFT_2828108 [Gautieria morchelliformis]|nr:hypothetical protein JB92DRAFT_2828108 [Gautieria morchelliformis]